MMTAPSDPSRIIGFSLVRNTHGIDNGHLWVFGIDHKFRQRGLGKMLIAVIINALKISEKTSMSLNVDYNNTAAYNLYKKMGFMNRWVLISRSWKEKI